MRSLLVIAGAASVCIAGCSQAEGCGPDEAVVERVIDGDTVELTNGERVRYLLVDAPEMAGGESECHAQQALFLNRALVEHRTIQLRYDVPCRDRFGRLLAFVTAGGVEVNSELVTQGEACVLHVPPSGASRIDQFHELERRARDDGRGLWGACAEPPCGR
jgi:micrococcal nuclease